ncbi:MAG: PEP-CTERM sorting domain-containing protein, partial [Deltaproteobacteria bacterium]|nr:PEP-CTERM sorting domain-containing protein [Deltaproteobacteria bacterium]
DLTSCEIPLIQVAPFQNPQIQIPPPDPDPDDEIDGLGALPAQISALKTIRLLNAGTERSQVDAVVLVDVVVPTPPMQLPSVVDDALATGAALVAVGTGPGARGPITLSPGEEFHIVLDGTTQDLLDALPDIVASGHFYMFPAVDLPTGEYLASVQSENPCASTGTISHLNPPTFVPEPGTGAMLVAGVVALAGLSQRRRRASSQRVGH